MATTQDSFVHKPARYQDAYGNNQWDSQFPQHNAEYDQGYTGYRDDAFVPSKDAAAEMTPTLAPPLGGLSEKRYVTTWKIHFFSLMIPSRSPGALKTWRHDEHGNVWTKVDDTEPLDISTLT